MELEIKIGGITYEVEAEALDTIAVLVRIIERDGVEGR